MKEISFKGSVFQIEVTGTINAPIINFMDDLGFVEIMKKLKNAFLGWLPDKTVLLDFLADSKDYH